MPRLLPLLTLAALPALAQNLDWQQVGGSLGVAATSKGIVGQGYETPLQAGTEYQIQGGFLAHRLMVNHAPFVATTLADLNLPLGFGSKTIRLDSVFADLDGDSLKYSIQTNGSAYDVSVSGDSLIIKEIEGSSGSMSVTITCSDGAASIDLSIQMGVSIGVGVIAESKHTLRSQDLSSRIPRLFASTIEGTGNGALKSGSCEETGDCLGLEILLPSASQVSVSIFDQIGTPVIALSQDIDAQALARLASSGDGRRILPLTWNLRAANGQAVAPGVYLWKVKVLTAGGQILETIHRMGVRGR